MCNNDDDWRRNRRSGGDDLLLSMALGEFEEAREGYLAKGASYGLYSVQLCMNENRRGTSLSTRSRFLREIACVHANCRMALPEIDTREMFCGFEAASGQVVYLFGSDEVRSAFSLEDLGALKLHARLLRNSLHNLALRRRLKDSVLPFVMHLVA